MDPLAALFLNRDALQARWESHVKSRPAIPWTENFPITDDPVIDAATWTPFRLFPVPGTNLKRKPEPETSVYSPSKQWCYDEHPLACADYLSLCTSTKRTHVVFNGEVLIPRIHELNPDGSYKELWMTYTPQEVATLRPGLRKAKKHTIIGGLGMGWLLTRTLQRKAVTKVTLVERSQELCDWVLPAIQTKVTPQEYSKLTVVVGDAITTIPTLSADVALWDIWKSLGAVDHDDEVKMAERCPNIKTTWFWGASVKLATWVWDW